MATAPVSREAAATSSGNAGQAEAGFPYRLLRRVFHLWFRLTRGMTMGVRAMVLDGDGRVFLVRHSYVPGWHLPGGGIEAGQNARDALEAELSEEGNILLTGEPDLFAIYRNDLAAPRDHVLLYVVRAFRQVAPRLPDREIVEARFFPLDDLPSHTTPATRRRLDEVLQRLRPSHTW